MNSKTTFRPLRQQVRIGPLRLLAALVLTASATLAAPRIAAASEFQVSGTGTFKPLSVEQLAGLPGDLAFSRNDLRSGRWSFSVRYEDTVRDTDPDPHTGRFVGAIRAFRLVMGDTTVDLPVDRAQIVVSDGGGGHSSREFIRLETTATLPAGILKLSWVQVNQQPPNIDLRGSAGVLSGDGLPAPAVVANLPVANPSDKFLILQIDRPGNESKPLLYLSSSLLSVTALPVTAP